MSGERIGAAIPTENPRIDGERAATLAAMTTTIELTTNAFPLTVPLKLGLELELDVEVVTPDALPAERGAVYVPAGPTVELVLFVAGRRRVLGTIRRTVRSLDELRIELDEDLEPDLADVIRSIGGRVRSA